MVEQFPLLRIQNLRKRLGNVDALDGITVDLPSGELVGLIGPNGAGKSTLLKCLAGHLRPDHGTIVLDAKPFSPGNPGAARAAGVRLVEQELALFPSLTASQNWELLTGSSRESREHSSKGLAALDWNSPVGLLEAADSQRLLLGAALSGRARVLMFDEPTALLDEHSASSFLDTLKSGKGGRTCLMATHRLNDLAHLDRWLFLQDGQIVLDTRTWSEAEAFFLSSGKKAATPALIEAQDGKSYQVEVNSPPFPLVPLELRGGSIVGLTAASGAPLYEFSRALIRELRVTPVAVSYLGPERQSDHVFGELSVGDHLALALDDGARTAENFRAVTELMLALGLEVTEPFRKRSIRTLSGGMQQKLFVAIACAKRADVRILCDPLRGVDRVSARAIGELLQRLRVSRDAVVVVSQDPELLLDCCDPIVIMAPHAEPILIAADEIASASQLVRQL